MNPKIVTLADDYAEVLGGDFDPYFAVNAMEEARKRCAKIPPRYADAVVTVQEISAWVRALVGAAVLTRRGPAVSLSTGPSLLLLGPTGVGKTREAYGVVRAMAETGVVCRWVATTAADAYARMRPRSGVDAEDEMRRLTHAQLLLLDDLGAAKTTEWTEEITYRIVNHRYEHELPTLITSNVPPAELAKILGHRVASRLGEMAHRVVLKGPDRRRGARPSWLELSDNDRDDRDDRDDRAVS